MGFINWLMNLFSWGKPEAVRSVTASASASATTTSAGASGDILLGYGLHEVKINLERPCVVFVSIKDTDGSPVCSGSVNKIGVQIVDTGFIIYADISTNSCTIEWTCE